MPLPQYLEITTIKLLGRKYKIYKGPQIISDSELDQDLLRLIKRKRICISRGSRRIINQKKQENL
jgi:hypothetical protein